MGLSLRNLKKKIVDVFDANTASDIAKRQAAGQPRYYQQQHPNAPARPTSIPRTIARPHQDNRNIFSKLYDQSNVFDNGRTFKNDTPTNVRSNLAQATHNGVTNAIGAVVKPIAINPLQSASEIGRFGAAQLTHNNKARNVSLERMKRNYDESLMGYGTNIVKNVGGGLGNFEAAAAADLMNKTDVANIARDEGINQFNKTPFGQVTATGQRHVVNAATKAQNKNLPKDVQNALVDQRVQNIGIDPKASLGKQLVDTGVNMLQLYGAAKGIENSGKVVNALKDGKVVVPQETVASKELPKVSQKGTPVQGTTPLETALKTSESVSQGTPSKGIVSQIDRYAGAKEYVRQNEALAKAAAKNTEKGTIGKAVLKIKTSLVDAVAPVETPINKVVGYGSKTALELRDKIDRSYKSSGIAHSFAEENGLVKTLQDVGKKDRAAFDQYLIAKRAQEAAAQGIETGRNLSHDAQFIQEVGGKFEKHAQAIYSYQRKLLDRAVEFGLVEKGVAEKLKRENPNYVPLERILNPDELATVQGNGRGVASVSKQTVVQKIKGSKRVVDSPLDAITSKTSDVFSQGTRSEAGKQLVAANESAGRPLEINPLRTAENVLSRRKAYSDLAELKPQRDALKVETAKLSKQFRELESRNKILGPQVLDKIMSGKDEIRNNAMREANGRLQGSGQRVAKLPNETQINEAFQQYLDGNPKLVQNMFEFGGNKAEQTRILNTLEGVKNQLDSVMNERKQLFSDARLLSDAEAKGKSTISFFNQGVKEVYEVPKEVAQAAKNMSPHQIGTYGKILSYPTRMLRLGATGINPAFTLANVTKDVLTGFINSEHAGQLANPKVFMAALDAAFRHGGENYKELAREGAVGTSFDLGRNTRTATVDKMIASKNAGTQFAYNVRHPSELLGAMEDVIGRSEEFGRAAQYFSNKEGALKAGKSLPEARMYAADAARNNTVNFSRAGELGRVVNTAVPYLNAGVQGSRTFVRSMKEHPVETSSKLALTVFTPIAATTAWNLSDPNRKKVYDQIPEYEKEGNIIIITPGAKFNDKTNRFEGVIKIPLSQEVSNLGSIVRYGVEDRTKDKSFDTKKMLGDIIGSTTSLNVQSPNQAVGQLLPQGAKPIIENVTNKNLFTGQQTVPDAMKNLDAKDQYTKSTSGTARVLGKLTNTSPLKIDNTIHTSLGGLGDNLINASDNILAKTGQISEKDIRGKNFWTSIANRFNSAQGVSPGGQYFKAIQDNAKSQKLAGGDYIQLNGILSKSVDQNGKARPLNEKDALEKANILKASPNIVKVLKAASIQSAKAQGKEVDPLYKLSDSQLQKYYEMQATPYKSEEYNRLKEQNSSWMQKLQDDRSVYFSRNPIPVGATETDKVKPPQISSSTQTKMDKVSAMSGQAKYDYIKANPDVQKAYDSISKYTNDKRIAQGYDPFKSYPKASASVQGIIDSYNKLPKGSARSSWIKSHPDSYAQMQNYYAATAAYQLANNAGKAKFEGTDLNQAALKAAYSLGQYDIKKNGDGTYTIDPQAVSADRYGGYGGSGGSGGSGKGVNPYKYAVSLNAGKVSLKGKIKVPIAKASKSVKKYAVGKPKVTSKRSRV